MAKIKSFALDESLARGFEGDCAYRGISQASKINELIWIYLQSSPSPTAQNELKSFERVMEAWDKGALRGRPPGFNPHRKLKP